MKKIFTLLALVLCTISTSFAQKGYTFEEKSVDQIQTGKDHMYVLRQSNNESTTLFGYLSSANQLAPVNEVDENCIFNFVKVGEVTHVDSTTMVDHTFNIYVIKNVANGKYIGNVPGIYTTIDKAFQVTAQKAVYSKEEEANDWIIYSKSSNGCTFDKQTPDGLGSWVFCNPYYRSYMTFRMYQASFPYFEYFRSHDAWLVYEVKERVMSAYEKFESIYNENFKNEVIPENYPIGNSVGCLPNQELYNEYESVFNEATVALVNQNCTDEEYDKLGAKIIEITKRVKEASVPFKPGYYLLISEFRNSAIYDPSDPQNPWFFGSLDKPAPDNFQFANSNYIWKISESETPGKYTIQNFKSSRYVGHSRGFALWWKMESEPCLFNIESDGGQWFNITNENKSHLSMSANEYGPNDIYVRESNHMGRKLWRFENINPDTLAVLMEPAKQADRNKELALLLDEANFAYLGNYYENHFSMSGQYLEGSEGLANAENTQTNSICEGNFIASAYDSNLSTFYHGQWQTTLAPTELHWIQIDLGKEVEEFYVKYTQHKGGDKRNLPVKFSIVTPEEGVEPLVEIPWTDTIARCEVTHFYPTNFGGRMVDSSTVVEKVKLNKPAQHIRFTVHATRGNLIRGGGPCWAASEFRIVDVADCKENVKMKAIKQEIIDNLKTVMDTANAELSRREATEATIKKIKECTEAFQKEYNTTYKLEYAIEKAQYLLDHAAEESEAESSTIGYYKDGSKAAFQAVVDNVKANTENKVLSMDDYLKYTKEIVDAENEFYNNLITIAESGFYQIVSRAGYNENGDMFVQEDGCLIAANADPTSGPKWGYKQSEGVDGRLNTIWYVEKSEKGYAFKNLANGLYINNVFEGMTPEEIEQANDSLDIDFRIARYSQTPKYFQLRPGKEPGQLMIALTDEQYLAMRADESNNVVHYFAINNAAAQFEFINITDDDFAIDQLFFDVPSNKTQIVTLPFESAFIQTNSGNMAHKVLGINGKYVRLSEYSEDETIKPGCPFIIKTNQNTEDLVDNMIIVGTNFTCLEDFRNAEFNYAPYNQNGMISSPVSFKLEPGFGFMFNGMVLVSEGGEQVYNGTGFFDKSIPTTTEEGSELMLPIDNQIVGDGTGVGNVTIQKNTNSNVYSISGAMVKHNVKLADATKGLSKGIYIINGKKVIVK